MLTIVSVRRCSSDVSSFHNGRAMCRVMSGHAPQIVAGIEQVVDDPKVVDDAYRRIPDQAWMFAMPVLMALNGLAVARPESERFKKPRRPMKVLRETDVSIAFDGGNNVGMLSLFYAAEATISKAAAHGIALVSVTDAWMSGRSAYYIEMIATPASLRSTQRPVHGWWLRPRRPVTTFRQRRRIVRHWRWTQEIWTKSCCPRSLVAAACRDPLRAGTSMQLSPSRSTCG